MQVVFYSDSSPLLMNSIMGMKQEGGQDKTLRCPSVAHHHLRHGVPEPSKLPSVSQLVHVPGNCRGIKLHFPDLVPRSKRLDGVKGTKVKEYDPNCSSSFVQSKLCGACSRRYWNNLHTYVCLVGKLWRIRGGLLAEAPAS